MTYRGEIHNGAIVLDEAITLPEGSKVTCFVLAVQKEVVPEQTGKKGTLADLLEFAGIVKDTPPDFSENHDKYLYGQP